MIMNSIKKIIFNNKIIFIISIISIILIIALAQIFGNLQIFNVKKLKIYGNQNLSSKFIYQMSGLSLDNNIFEINLKDVENKINQYYLIKNVIVEKELPDTVSILLEERFPVAYVKSYNSEEAKNYFYEIDSEGIILNKKEFAEDTSLIIYELGNFGLEKGIQIIDRNIIKNINNFFEFLKPRANFKENIAFIRLDSENDNYIKLISGEKIFFGKKFDGADLKKLKSIQDIVPEKSIIDLRYNKFIVFRD